MDSWKSADSNSMMPLQQRHAQREIIIFHSFHHTLFLSPAEIFVSSFLKLQARWNLHTGNNGSAWWVQNRGHFYWRSFPRSFILIDPSPYSGANSTVNFPWWFYTILPLLPSVLYILPTFYYQANFQESTKWTNSKVWTLRGPHFRGPPK